MKERDGVCWRGRAGWFGELHGVCWKITSVCLNGACFELGVGGLYRACMGEYVKESFCVGSGG